MMGMRLAVRPRTSVVSKMVVAESFCAEVIKLYHTVFP